MEETVESWLNVEFNHAKYTKDLWGRLVIQAIDMDNCFDLYNCMHKAGEKINTQMTILGYDQYLWTSAVHKFLGDTALHFAIRQKKMMCVHMLLILKAKTDIPNAVGITAESLSLTLFSTNIKNLEFEAYKFILNRINLKDIDKLPDSFRYRHIEKEAWKLMEDGRILYSELPTSFVGDDTILNKHLYNVRKNYLSFNVRKPASAVAVAPAEAAAVAVSSGPAASTSTSVPASSVSAPETTDTPPLSSSVSSSRAASASTKTRPTDKKAGNSSTESSATSSRVGSPLPSPTRPGKIGAEATKSSAKASTTKDTKSAKGKGKPGSDSESASSKTGGTKGKSTKSTKSKASTLSGNYDSDSSADSSQASSVGSLLKIKSKKTADKDKSKGAKAAATKGKNNKQSDEEEVAPKEVVPPKPRTLREQYEDSGTKMTQRAELEVLREDIKHQTERLCSLSDQSTVTPGVSVPPLPQDFAVTLIEQERKLRSLQRELHEKSQLYYASINTPKSVSPGKRGANKGTGKAVGLEGNTAADLEGGRRASAKVKTGVAAAPAAALATGDVWGRDNLCDVIYLIERQKALHYERTLASRQPVAKGLKLLDSVKISNSVERVIAHERDLQVGKGDSLYIPEELSEMQGVKKLKFMNLNKLRSLAQSTTVQQANSKTGPAGRLAKSISDKILLPQDSAVADSLESSSLDATSFGGGASRVSSHTQRRYIVPEVPEYETMRQITKFSTHSNMKYMKIGEEGAEQLGIVLQNDEVVTELCLAGARISCVGATFFAKYLPDIKALRYLDLSNNAISDKGAVALASALPYCVLLEQLNLMGNRIASVGAVRLILAVFSSPLHWLR